MDIGMDTSLQEANGTLRLWTLFTAYVLLYAAVSYVTNELVVTDEMLLEEWQDIAGLSEVALEQQRRWMRLGYAFIPMALGAKVLFTSLCLATGSAVAGWYIRFRTCMSAAVHSEAVLALAAVVQLLSSLFVVEFDSFTDYASFYPLSVLSLVELDRSELWMAYSLKTANLFEVVYAGALVLSLERALQKPRRSILAVVACSYGAGLLLLVCTMTFLALYVS